jgi:hypothetical protein
MPHEQPKDAQAMLVRQCGQRSDDLSFIHASMSSRTIAIINVKFGALSERWPHLELAVPADAIRWRQRPGLKAIEKLPVTPGGCSSP